MRRLGLTMLATAWIVAATVGYGILGAIIQSYGFWVFAWIPALIITAAPFAIYALTED